MIFGQKKGNDMKYQLVKEEGTRRLDMLERRGARPMRTAALALLACVFAAGTAFADDPKPLPESIVVGATLPLTGLGAAYGTIMQEGMQLGFAEAEKSGVAGATKFKLEIRDSQALPAQSVSLTRDLVNAGAVAIVSAFTAPPLAQVPIAARSKVPVFNGGGNDPALLGRDYLWNDVMMLDQEAKVGMQYASETLKAKKIGILFETSYTPTALSSIEAAWKDVGGTESVSETVDLAATSVGPQLEKLLAAKPDAIYLAIDGNISSLAFKELGQRNVKIPLITYSGGAVVPEAKSTPGLELYFTTRLLPSRPASTTSAIITSPTTTLRRPSCSL
jgi:branched-chain amino acid transport system substrate-binding protein